jgi:hypothetical protein
MTDEEREEIETFIPIDKEDCLTSKPKPGLSISTIQSLRRFEPGKRRDRSGFFVFGDRCAISRDPRLLK